MRAATGSLLIVPVLLAGCSGSADKPDVSDSPTRAAPAAVDRLCADPDLNDKQVSFTAPAGQVAAYVLGTGSTALILAPQASATGCSWLSWAKREAAAGYTVVAFDFHGEGRSRPAGDARNSTDVTAAATYARTRGATGVVLIGASRGGTATLVAAAALTPPPAAVISLSAPAAYAGEDAGPTAPKLSAPTLYVAAQDDAPFPADAQALYDATPAAVRTLTVVPGRTHGTALLTTTADGTDQAAKAVDDFLAEHAKP
jgi:pimeloyl-ACP methyl ester carboxylesterase